jgi:periplasmic protein TonB
MSLVNTFHSDNVNFNPHAQQKKSRQVAVLVLVAVIALHGILTWLLSKKPTVTPSDTVVIMEVSMLQKSNSALKQAAPAPPAAKKEPIKPKTVVKPKPIKKPDVVKKPAPKPPEIKELNPIPKFTPTPPAAVSPSTTTSSTPTGSAATNTATATGSGSNNRQTVASNVVPLVRVPPEYPEYASRRHIEGWVKVEFTVSTDGSVEDAVVVSSEPDDIFDDAAITAINQWEFKEKIINGVAVTQRAVQKLQFKLDH